MLVVVDNTSLWLRTREEHALRPVGKRASVLHLWREKTSAPASERGEVQQLHLVLGVGS